MQKSYRLIVTCEGRTVWDSGEQKSSRSVLIPYEGEKLKEEQTYHVELKVTDSYGEEDAEEMTFTTGVFDSSHFRAKMITHDFPEEETACPGVLPSVFFEETGGIRPPLCYGVGRL